MALLDGRRLSRPKALVRSLVRSLDRSLVRSLVRTSCPARPWILAFVHLRRIAAFPLLLMFLVVLAAVCGMPVVAFGQADVNAVHIQPREAEKTKTEEVATQSMVSPTLNTRVRPLKVAVDLVLVPVTITDPLNRLVTGLEKENFQLFEGSRPRT